MNYLLKAILIVIPISVATIGFITIRGQQHLGKHRGVSREEFIRAFDGSGIPAEIPAAVYDFYKSQVFSKDFSVAPDDDYEQVLSEGDDDIEDDTVFLMKRLGLRMIDDASIQPETRIRTLRDMVYWLDRIRQYQAK